MAKQTLKSDVILIAAASMHWFQSLQSDERANSFGNPFADFPESYARDGWDNGQGIVKSWLLSDDEQKQAIKDRIAYVEKLEADATEVTLYHRDGNAVKVPTKEIGAFARSLWTDDKGKWIAPTHGGNCCYRRGYALPASLMAYRQYQGTSEDFAIPATVTDYGDGKDRAHRMHLDRLKENSQHGRKGYSPVDQLVNTVKLVGQTYTESDVMHALNLKRGMAQKLHALALLAKKYGELDIVKRCKLSPPRDNDAKLIENPAWAEGCYIPLSKIKPGLVRTLLGKAKTADKMDDTAAAAMGHREPNRQATAEQVEQAIKLVIEGTIRPTSMMSRENLKVLIEGLSANQQEIKNLLEAILVDSGPAAGEAVDKLTASLQ